MPPILRRHRSAHRVGRLTLATLILLAFCHGSGAALPCDEQAIADVRAGRVDTARASWWGFDANDSTEALQAAIDSRARRVIIDDAGSPWVVTTIRLPSNKEIVLESGVVIEAKRNEFRGRGDCLFVAQGVKHLAILGKGAVLRMHKDDYHQPPYEPAEWRHALSICGCEDVTVEGLTLQESGGDGVYLGRGRDGATNVGITIRRVLCDGNNRQGISIITAENLLIEDCVFRRTGGTAPQAGVDFEPNRPEERLVNCVLRNCRSEDNAGYGYLIYLGNLSCQSDPVSIRFENCVSKDCQQPSVYLGMANRDGERTVKGSIELLDCRFEADSGGGILIRGNETDGCLQRLQRCEIIRRDENATDAVPILVEAPSSLGVGAGNIEIIDCVIRDAIARNPISLLASPLSGLPDISGSLTYSSPAGRKSYTLDAQQLAEWFPEQGRTVGISPFVFAWQHSKPLATGTPIANQVANENQTAFALRAQTDLLLWGRAGGTVTLRANLKTVGRHKLPESSMTVTAPQGETWKLNSEPEAGQIVYSFTPSVTGSYRLRWYGGPNAAIEPIECSVPWNLLLTTHGLHLFRCTGTLFFLVPEGVERFAIEVSGEGSGETVRATLRDAAGEVIESKDNIARPHVFVPPDGKPKAPGIWSLTLEKATEGVLEDVTIQTLGIPPLFAASRDQVFKSAPQPTQ